MTRLEPARPISDVELARLMNVLPDSGGAIDARGVKAARSAPANATWRRSSALATRGDDLRAVTSGQRYPAPSRPWRPDGESATGRSSNSAREIDSKCASLQPHQFSSSSAPSRHSRLARMPADQQQLVHLSISPRQQSWWVSLRSARFSTSWRRPPLYRDEIGRCRTADRCLGFSQASP
jgi:hypothetical protein